jgi:hypothetical protein
LTFIHSPFKSKALVWIKCKSSEARFDCRLINLLSILQYACPQGILIGLIKLHNLGFATVNCCCIVALAAASTFTFSDLLATTFPAASINSCTTVTALPLDVLLTTVTSVFNIPFPCFSSG